MRRFCIFAVTLKTEDYSFFVSLRQKKTAALYETTV